MTTTTTPVHAPAALQPATLTTGWEPELPAGDTVLRRFSLHYAEYFASAAVASGGTVTRTERFAVADHGRPAGFFNSAVLLQPPRPDGWDDVLAEIEDAFLAGSAGRGDVFLWSPFPTPDLAGRGWELEGHPPLLVRPPGGSLPRAAAGLRVAEVRGGPGLEDWARVVVEGFPFPDLQPYRAGTLFDERLLRDPRWRLWVGYEDHRPVSAGALFTAVGLAQLAGGVTLPEARGRGYWYALVRERLLAAPDLLSGSLFSDDSRPGAERLGYLPVVRFTCWHRSRPAPRRARPAATPAPTPEGTRP